MKKYPLFSSPRKLFTINLQRSGVGVPVRTGVRAGVVGRPLTPVSVAGVSRRTVRRNVYY